jgi:hypothetical protein
MRRRTVAVLVVCWGLLSAAAWTAGRPAILDWATQNLAGRVGAEHVQPIASATANVLPCLAAGVVVLLIAVLAWRNGRQNVVQRTSSPAALAAARRIYIKPEKTLVNSGARFGVVLLRDSGGIRATAPSNEIYFKKLDSRGTLMAQIPRDGHRAQFRCFVDYRGLKFERVKRALRASRFTVVTPPTDGHFRAWFLLPGFKTGQTADGKINTFS